MTPQGLMDWLGDQRAELEDFCTYAQSYVKRRERRGYQTTTDNRYHQFFERAADLIAGLAEMHQLAEEAKQAAQGPPGYNPVTRS